VTFRRTTQLPRLGAAVAAVALVATACGGSSGGGSAAGSPSAGTETAASTIVGSASAPITKDSVTVGNVATLSGPIPGLFQGAPYGVDAYFAMVHDPQTDENFGNIMALLEGEPTWTDGEWLGAGA